MNTDDLEADNLRLYEELQDMHIKYDAAMELIEAHRKHTCEVNIANDELKHIILRTLERLRGTHHYLQRHTDETHTKVINGCRQLYHTMEDLAALDIKL